jgi:hypothetical protein
MDQPPALTTGSSHVWSTLSPCPHDNRPDSIFIAPANEAVSWHSRVFLPKVHSNFVGKPNATIDAHWKALLQYNNVRISEEDMVAIGRDKLENNVHLPDGGYAATLSVFHDLHCLKRIYQSLFPDYYLSDYTEEELGFNMEHTSMSTRFSLTLIFPTS